MFLGAAGSPYTSKYQPQKLEPLRVTSSVGQLTSTRTEPRDVAGQRPRRPRPPGPIRSDPHRHFGSDSTETDRDDASTANQAPTRHPESLSSTGRSELGSGSNQTVLALNPSPKDDLSGTAISRSLPIKPDPPKPPPLAVLKAVRTASPKHVVSGIDTLGTINIEPEKKSSHQVHAIRFHVNHQRLMTPKIAFMSEINLSVSGLGLRSFLRILWAQMPLEWTPQRTLGCRTRPPRTPSRPPGRTATPGRSTSVGFGRPRRGSSG